MSPHYMSKYFSLDWDNISIDEASKRCDYILENYTNVQKLVLCFSGVKGFHVRCYCHGLTNVAKMRNELKDDGRRLVHDLLNRPDNIHDVLWVRKTIEGIPYESKPLVTMVRVQN